MKHNRKIVVIGAGSAEFGSQSLFGIMNTEGLHGFELHLVDIDAEKLALITGLAERLNRELGAEMRIRSSTRREEALPDAGFVVLSIAIEREDLWLKDQRLALKCGLRMLAVRDRIRGRNLYPELREKAGALPATFEPLTRKLFEIFGIMPVPGDWRRRQEGLRRIREVVEGRESIEVLRPRTSERVEFIIDGIANDRHQYEEALNIPNRGCIGNLPEGAIVFAIDPMIQDPEVATGLADAYLELYEDYLPSFD